MAPVSRKLDLIQSVPTAASNISTKNGMPLIEKSRVFQLLDWHLVFLNPMLTAKLRLRKTRWAEGDQDWH
jgi:hypothetical protein